eukprot:235279_1
MSLFQRRGLPFLTKQEEKDDDESSKGLLLANKRKMDMEGDGDGLGIDSQLPLCRHDDMRKKSLRRRKGVLCLIFLLGLGCTVLVFLYMLYRIPRVLFPVSKVMPFSDNYSKCREKVSAGLEPDEGMFTVVVNSYKRPRRMRKAVNHYRSCCGVKSVVVIWCEEDRHPPPLSFFTDNKRNGGDDSSSKFDAPIAFEERRNSLNSRFEPIPNITTEAVFHVDDDIEVPCSGLHTAFQVWLLHKNTLVGFFPRIHTRINKGMEDDKYPSYIYGYWWTVWKKRSYSIILTKAAFLHVDFMMKYTYEIDERLRKYVDDHMSCEDILMAHLVAKESKVPPVYVRGDVKDTGVVGGISTQEWIKSHHAIERSKCISDISYFMANYDTPLIETNASVPHSTSRWDFLPSTWCEWFSGDEMKAVIIFFQFWK